MRAVLLAALLAACGDNVVPGPAVDSPACPACPGCAPCPPDNACTSLPCLSKTCIGVVCHCTLPLYGPDSIPITVTCHAP